MSRPWEKGDNAARSAIFIDWLLTPKELRQPKTMRALATELGVSEDTLRLWRKDPGFGRRLTSRAREVTKVESLPDILATLHVQATDPSNPRSVQASKLLIEFMESHTSQASPLSNLSDDELVALVQRALSTIYTGVAVE